MNTTLIIVLIVAAIVVVALVVAAVVASRRRALRQRFGPEYDRAVAERKSRSAAERELRERERRHADLDLRPLSPEARAAYAEQWAAVQTQFVDAPEEAVRAGDALVTRLIGEIGYPTEDYEDQIATLSVEHARTLTHYRDAHDIFLRTEHGEASTEQLRQALVHYRALFAELLGDQPVPPADEEPSAPPATAATDTDRTDEAATGTERTDTAGTDADVSAEADRQPPADTAPAAGLDTDAPPPPDGRPADKSASKQPHYR